MFHGINEVVIFILAKDQSDGLKTKAEISSFVDQVLKRLSRWSLLVNILNETKGYMLLLYGNRTVS